MTDEVPAARVVVPVRLVGVTPAAALLVAAAVFSAFVLRNAFVDAHRIVGWIVACGIVALLIDPVVDRLQRHLPRWLSLIIVVAGAVLVFAGVIVALVREVRDSLDDLERAAPDAARGLEERYDWAVDVDVTARVADFVEGLNEGFRREALQRTLSGVPAYFVTAVLTLFLLAFGRRYVLGAVGLITDLERRRLVRRVASRATARGRRYMLWSLAHAAFNGVVFGAVCWSLDIVAPLSLGVAVAVLSVIPLIGIFVGGAPALLLAYGLQNWRVGTAVLIVLLALQVFEVWKVRPFVDARSVRLGASVPIVVALLAFELYGFGAAVYSVALAVLGLAALDATSWARGDEPAGDADTPETVPSP
jgi:putative heme transporter